MAQTVDLDFVKQSQIGDPSSWATEDANALLGSVLPMFLKFAAGQIDKKVPMFNKFIVDRNEQWAGGMATWLAKIRRDTSFFVTVDNGQITTGQHP